MRRRPFTSILRLGIWLHVDEFPNMNIQVLECVFIHKSVILWFAVYRASGDASFGNEVIDLLPAVARSVQQDFRAFRGGHRALCW